MELSADPLAQNPISASLVARPARVCVFTPHAEGVSWERLVEHALATQIGVWGGAHNLVIPLWDGIEEDEMFWRLVGRFDPDLIGLHMPTWTDAESIAPDVYDEESRRFAAHLDDQGYEDGVKADFLRQFHEARCWNWDLPEGLKAKIVERLAPLRHADKPRSVVLDGEAVAPYPLTDVASLGETPSSLVDIRSDLDAVDALLLTHAVGRLLPSLKQRLAAKNVVLNEVLLQDRRLLPQHLWPGRPVVHDYAYPLTLPELGLARRLIARGRENPLVVVGDGREDFVLFHVLSRLRPNVSWCPESRFADDEFVRGIGNAVTWAIRNTGEVRLDLVSRTDRALPDAFIARLQGLRAATDAEPRVVQWPELVPASPIWAADAKSERRVSLLPHQGETHELPTPIPLSVSVAPDDFMQLRWMVDVEVQDWTPLRHAILGSTLLRGSLVTDHDVRTSVAGPSYFGQSAFVQAFLGLEGSTSKPRLHPLSIRGQIEAILASRGWEARDSDKGTYASRSSQLFGGMKELATTLRSPSARTILDSYVNPKDDSRPGWFLTDTRRRYLRLADARILLEETGAAEVDALITRFSEIGVLNRGHVLKCSHCRATSFYSLREDQGFRCTRCGTDQRATRSSWLGEPEPPFAYGLSEVVFQFLQHKGHIPFLATYEHFVEGRASERRPFDAAFEMEVLSPEAGRREHDVVASWGSELWLGEATTRDRFENTNADELERLELLRETAIALNATGIVLVTTQAQFGSSTRGRIRATFGEGTDRFEVIVKEGFDAGPMQ
jgi:hypothetical protein